MTHVSPSLQGMFLLQLWQVTLLVVVVGLVAVTTLRRRPHVAYLLWALLFVKCLIPPLWSSPTGIFSWLEGSRYSLSQTFGAGQSEGSDSTKGTATRLVLEQVSPSQGSTETAILPAVEATDTAHGGGYWLSALPVARIGFAVWILGSVLLLGLAYLRLRRMARALAAEGCRPRADLEAALHRLAVRLGVPRPVRLVISNDNNGPLVFGFRRPLIVLPAVMVRARTVSQLEPILAHELIHVRRGDTILGAVQFLAQVVWWFHPMIWWASRQLNRACERCCDGEAIISLECPPRDYAASLLDVLEFKSALRPGFATPGVRAVDITKNRIRYIMHESDHFRTRPAKLYWCLAVVLALTVLPGGAWLMGGRQDQGTVRVKFSGKDPIDKLRVEARIAFEAKEWGRAASALAQVVERVPDDARSWFLRGYALHAAGELDEAIKVHRHATRFPATRVSALYNLSCAFALLGDKEEALQHLQQSLDAGFISAIPITEDQDFASLLDDPAFQKLAERAQPPSSREVYRQFDFLVGDWNVTTPSGEVIGRNVITKDVKGFLLTEKWTNSNGGTGTSISFYDPGEQNWRQTWVDERGTVVRYKGVFEAGEMHMDGTRTLANGREMLCRKRYTRQDDGTVRQINECSEDDGQTWSVYFDAIYRPNPTMVLQMELAAIPVADEEERSAGS